MRSFVFVVLALALLASRAGAEMHHPGNTERCDAHAFVDLGYQQGDAPGGRSYWRYEPRISATGCALGTDGVTTSGHPFGIEYAYALGWRSGEHTTAGKEIPGAAVPIGLYLEGGYYAAVRALHTSSGALVAFAGPHLTLGGPEWNAGWFRLGLVAGLRYALTSDGRDFVADFRVKPVELRQAPLAGLDENGDTQQELATDEFDRIDYSLALYTQASDLLWGVRFGLVQMRDRGFYGRQWGIALVGGF